MRPREWEMTATEPQRKGHVPPCRATRGIRVDQEAEGVMGKCGEKPFP